MKVRSFYDKSFSEDFEAVNPVSETIPDQSLSVKDILLRFTRGTIQLPPIETGEDDDIDSLGESFDDLTDAEYALSAGQEIINDFRNRPQNTSFDSPDQETVEEKQNNDKV